MMNAIIATTAVLATICDVRNFGRFVAVSIDCVTSLAACS
jgi:hypothetical protein